MQCNDNVNDQGEDRKVVDGSTQSSFRNVNQSINSKRKYKDRKIETDPNVQVLPVDRARDDPGEGTARGTHVCKQVFFQCIHHILTFENRRNLDANHAGGR